MAVNWSNVRTALALCKSEDDHELPAEVERVFKLTALLSRLPSAGPAPIDDLVVELLEADPDDGWQEALQDAIATYNERVFILEANRRANVSGRLEEASTRVYWSELPSIAARLEPVFAAAVDHLRTAAPRLPAGPDALDPTAVLHADVSSAYKTAWAACEQITTIASAFDVPIGPDLRTPDAARLLAVVDLPDDLVPELTAGLFPKLVSDPDELARVQPIRALAEAYSANPRLALLDLARGAYGTEATFRLATTRADIHRRVDALRTAHLHMHQREDVS